MAKEVLSLLNPNMFSALVFLANLDLARSLNKGRIFSSMEGKEMLHINLHKVKLVRTDQPVLTNGKCPKSG